MANKLSKTSLPVAILLAIAAALWNQYGPATSGGAQSPGAATAASARPAGSDAILDRAFRERAVDLQVRGSGEVVHILPDDNKGSRHQRFLLETGTGLTLLVAHNIDLAPRIPDLRRGDRVEFHGEYEWNEKGGVIHWTHHDPRGSHVGGWLEHEGTRYE